MKLSIESEREADGRWLAEVPELPGVMAYGTDRNEALAKAQVLALRVLAERIEHNETDAQRTELDRRIADHETNPNDVVPCQSGNR